MHLLINTGGGDAPGLNAVIRAIVLSARERGWYVTGIKNGYDGLLQEMPDGLIPLGRRRVRDIAPLGGTILGTKNKDHPFEYPVKQNGKTVFKDISDKVIAHFKELKADALIAIGGDGSMKLAQRFFEKGVPVVGIPKTIDNDLNLTTETFGFDTAVWVATEAIDRLHTTAEAHQRVMVVEVMGRYAGWIALNAGVAGGADVILIPEIDYDIKKVCQKIKQREKANLYFALIVVAEGAKPKGGKLTFQEKKVGGPIRLGGLAEKVALEINQLTGKETRFIVLGHLQRGGGPTALDRLMATRFGAAAVRLVEKKDFGKMVALQQSQVVAVPIKEAISKRKIVPIQSDTIQTARDLGISFGD